MNVFIGELPPPYGGVAVKDKILYQEVYKSSGVKMLNLVECKWKPWKIPIIGIKLIILILVADNVIVGVGTNLRRKIIMRLRYILRGKAGLKKTRMMMMAGVVQNVIKDDYSLKKLLLKLGTLWVETEGMKKELVDQGFRNVKLYPNCRTEENSLPPIQAKGIKRYVFFSRICEMKGVDGIFHSISTLTGDWSMDFYGEIDEKYKEEFQSLLKEYPQVVYHGVFDSTNDKVYGELNQYDILLFPSRYTTEGVPGVLVEAKMAGITAIVTNTSYNHEIVTDGVDGVVIKSTLADELNALSFDEINKYKQNAYKSRKKYSINTYREQLLSELS